MSRILLADDSPHAQRMGQQILADEGFEVVIVSDGDTALLRLEDVDPDLVLADTVMPKRSGYELCQYLKISPRHRHTRVILTFGAQEPLDEGEARRSKADGLLRKPFEASVLLSTVRPLVEAAQAERGMAPASAWKPASPAGSHPMVALIDPEQLRAAVTVALNAAMPKLVEEVNAKVLLALQTSKNAR